MERRLTICVLGLILCTVPAMAQCGRETSFVTAKQMRQFWAHVPLSKEAVEDVLLVQLDDNHGNAIALAIESARGRELLVYCVATQKPKLLWRSGTLPDEFQLWIGRMKFVMPELSRAAIQFEGCRPHFCGRDIGILLYVPALKSSFSVTRDNCTVVYSENLSSTTAAPYKEWLDQQLKEHRP